MNRALVRAATAICTVACLVGGTASAAAKSDGLNGNWVLNAGKSSYDPGPAYGDGKIAYTEKKGTISAAIDVTVGGKPVHIAYTGPEDGSSIAVSGSPNYDSVSLIKPDKSTRIRTERRGGKVVGITTITLATDGKSFTAEGRGTNAAGQKYHNVSVWDRVKKK
jgi:hypothetical protein